MFNFVEEFCTNCNSVLHDNFLNSLRSVSFLIDFNIDINM